MKYKLRSYIHMFVGFLLLTMAMTILIFFMKNYIKADKRIIEFDEENKKILYLKVYEVYGQDNVKDIFEFFAEKNVLNRMKTFYNFLNAEFDFIEFNKQNLFLKDDFNYKDEFRIDYEWSDFGVNDHIGISLNSIQIAENTYNTYNLDNYVYYGEGFHANDYIYEYDDGVNAILGYEYLGLIDIGDTLNFEYLTKNITIKVVGFFEKGTSIAINQNILSFDRSIAIPSLNLNYNVKNEEDDRFQKILYSLKTCGYIRAENGKDFYEYKDKVDHMAKELDLKYVVNEFFMSEYINDISNTIYSIKGIFVIFSTVLFIILSVIVTYIYIWNYNRNKRNYSIHLICGCSFTRLKLKVLFSIILQFILSFIGSYFINIFMLGNLNIYKINYVLLYEASNYTLSISAIIIIIICAILNYHINRSNIYNSIKSEN